MAVQLAALLQGLEHDALEVDVRGGRERFGGLGLGLAVPVGVEDLAGQAAEAHALLHGAFGESEPCGDLLGRGVLRGQAAERADLVGRVHDDAHRVLDERGLSGRVVVDDEAGNRVVLGDVFVGGEDLQRA